MTVPLGQVAVFQCGGRGTFLLWWINDDLVVQSEQQGYESRGFTFEKSILNNGTTVITLTILATVGNNNTQLRCHATGNPRPNTSEPVNLTVAGTKEQLELKCNP